VIVLRDGRNPFEVLMVERSSRGMFGGLTVFPGGTVDDADRAYSSSDRVAADDLDHRLAALRELCEETGLLATGGGLVTGPGGIEGPDLLRWLAGKGSALDTGALTMVSRWVTPEDAAQRFDTRFYLLPASGATEATVNSPELVGCAWVTPQEALARLESGTWRMILPTIAHLRWLARRSSIGDAVASADGADGRTLIRPRRVEDGSLVPIHLPGGQR
jgi:8-oxo-dGTP pyrophosphatase MutT (NUDIX family)